MPKNNRKKNNKLNRLSQLKLLIKIISKTALIGQIETRKEKLYTYVKGNQQPNRKKKKIAKDLSAIGKRFFNVEDRREVKPVNWPAVLSKEHDRYFIFKKSFGNKPIAIKKLILQILQS